MNSRTGAAARRTRGAVVGTALSVAFLIAGVSPALGAEVIGAWGGTITQRSDGGIVAGNSFNTASFGTYTINSLGFVDIGNDGISGSYQVGIWDSSQNLLGSTTVTPSSPLINGFRYAPIAPVTLPNSSTFTIGALLPINPADPWLEAQFLVLGVGYTGQGLGRIQNSGSLVFPGNVADTPYVVANASDVIVPEPASVALVGAVVLIMRRRGRASSAM